MISGNQMKRVIIVHGWGGNPEEGWFPWLKKELESRGYRVSVPPMPDSDNPKIESWVRHLSKIVGKPDENTFFVGHSIGCQAILRYLETIDTKVGGAVFVAGWFKLENLENEEEEEIAHPWVANRMDLKKIKTVLPKSTLIISDNDPYGAFDENQEDFRRISSEIKVLHLADHINGESGHFQLPEALAKFEN